MRQEREHCCDDLAVSLSGDRLLYARALASMETLRALPPLLPANLAIGARGGHLLPRIRRLLGLSPAPRPMFTVSTAIVTLLLLAGLIYVGCSKEMAQSAASQNPPPSTAPAIAEATNNAPVPSQAAFAAASNAEAEPITIETRVILVPEKFLDDIRMDWWDVKLSVAGPVTAPGTSAPDAELQESLIDNWTLSLIEKKLAADQSSSIQGYPPLLLANNALGAIPLTLLSKDQATNDPRLIKSIPVTASLSQDRKYVILGFPQASEPHTGQAIHPFMVSCPDGGTLMLSRVAMDAGNTPRHYLIIIKPSIRAAATSPAATAPSASVGAAGTNDTLVRDGTGYMRQNVGSTEHLIPYSELIIYPSDWMEFSRPRTGESSSPESAASLAIRAKLQEKMGGFYADQLPLNQTIDSLSKATGMTVSVDWKALETVGIKRDTPVTINLNWSGISIPARTVLATIFLKLDGDKQVMGYTLEDGVVAVSTRQSFEAAGLQLRNASVALPPLLQPGPPASPPALAPASSQPAGSTPATTTSAEADSIQIETAYIMASRDFMDDFRVGWDLNLAASPGSPQAAGTMHFSVIDEWTRNLLLKTVQGDKKSKISDPSKTVIPDGKSGGLTWPLNESLLNAAITPTASADGRYILMKAIFSVGKLPTSVVPDTRTAADHQTAAGASVVGSMPPISVPDGATLLIDAGEISPPAADPATTNAKPGRMLILVRPSLSKDSNLQPGVVTATQAVAPLPPTSNAPSALKSKDEAIQVYDIRDLLVIHADRGPPLSMPFDATKGSVNPNSVSPMVTKEMMAQKLIDAIESAVEPVSWRDKGGTIGSIRNLNGQLIVNQTLENQREVLRFLQQYRASHSVQIALESRFVLVDDGVVALLPKPVPAANGTSTQPANKVELDDAVLAKFLDAIEKSGTADTLVMPRVTTANGQHGFVAKTNMTNYVINVRPDIPGKVVPNIDVGTLAFGSVLDLMATASSDRKSVMLQLNPMVRQLEGTETIPLPGIPAPFSQKPIVSEVQIPVTVSVPDGRAIVLIGGKLPGDFSIVTPDALPVGKKVSVPDPSKLRRLLVIVRPTIILHPEAEPMPPQSITMPSGLPDGWIQR